MKIKIIYLILFLFSMTSIGFAQDENKIDSEFSEAIKLQREKGKVQKELELIEMQAKIAELKKKMAQDQLDVQTLKGGPQVTADPGYSQGDVLLSDVALNDQLEIKMILASADSRKALLKSGNNYYSVKIGDFFKEWQVSEIDKDSVLFKKEEELKRYRISVW